MRRQQLRLVGLGLLGFAPIGCVGSAWHSGPLASPLRGDAYIHKPIAAPLLEPAPAAGNIPEPPKQLEAKSPVPAGAPLQLANVVSSVENHFPLLFAIEQERGVAAGRRVSAEGQFDPVARSRFLNQSGTFSSRTFDVNLEQPTPFWGITGITGYRTGFGDYPDYNGGNLTADGGELRAGLTVPILRGGAIDPRRARLAAAQIEERLADPVIRTARISFFRDASIAYWLWVAAGAQYQVQLELLELASKRQVLNDALLKEGQGAKGPVEFNRRLLAQREELLEAANRNLQAAAIRLSLFLRNANGDPYVPTVDQLPRGFINYELPTLNVEQLAQDVELARQQRPELERFRLQRERLAVDLKLATNDLYPLINFFTTGAQDVGPSKKSDLDRTNVQTGVTFEMPLPRRDAFGRTRTAQAQMLQVLLQERDLRDNVQVQVQDAISELETTAKRIKLSREALRRAVNVLELQKAATANGLNDLVLLNIQEIAAAEAQTVIVTNLTQYYTAVARYLAALGYEVPPDGRGGYVLPSTLPPVK